MTKKKAASQSNSGPTSAEASDEKALQHQLEIARSHHDRIGESLALSKLGGVSMESRNPAKALDLFHTGISSSAEDSRCRGGTDFFEEH